VVSVPGLEAHVPSGRTDKNLVRRNKIEQRGEQE